MFLLAPEFLWIPINNHVDLSFFPAVNLFFVVITYKLQSHQLKCQASSFQYQILFE
uniref:Uncharacterized protein n=1 Tax=Anguilla anguilla TaxID=7936 RepID=A0A0E9R6L1_ANGAN